MAAWVISASAADQPNCGVSTGKWKGVVLDRRKGLNVELYDLSTDEGEQTNVAGQYPEIAAEIRKMMEEAHEPSPFWD